MKKLLTLLIVLTPLCAAAQGVRHDNIAFKTAVPSLSAGVAGAILQPIANAIVTVCSGSTLPAVGVACSPTTTIYSNITLTTVLSNPTNADGNGNYFFYAVGALSYVISVAGSGLTTYSYVWTAPSPLPPATLNQLYHSGPIPSWGPVVDADITPAYSGVGAAPANQFVTTLTRNAAPTTAQPSFANLSGSVLLAQLPLTTRGDLLTVNATPALARLAVGGANLYVKSNGTDPVYSTLAAGGVGGCSAGSFVTTLNADAAPTCGAQQVVPQVVQQNFFNTLSSNQAISATTLTTINNTSQAITFPASGGPWRVMISWFISVNYNGTGGGVNLNGYVTDGTNNFATSGLGTITTSTIGFGFAGSQVTNVTYANGAVRTFDLKIQASLAITANAAPTQAGQNTYLSLTVISSN